MNPVKTSDESYEDFLRVMKSGRSAAGDDESLRRRAAVVEPVAQDAERAAPAEKGGDDAGAAPEEAARAGATTTLPESTHSFLFTEPVFSPPFWIGLGVAAVSGASLALAFYNNLQDGSIPVNVPGSVKCAAFLCESPRVDARVGLRPQRTRSWPRLRPRQTKPGVARALSSLSAALRGRRNASHPPGAHPRPRAAGAPRSAEGPHSRWKALRACRPRLRVRVRRDRRLTDSRPGT